MPLLAAIAIAVLILKGLVEILGGISQDNDGCGCWLIVFFGIPFAIGAFIGYKLSPGESLIVGVLGGGCLVVVIFWAGILIICAIVDRLVKSD